MEFLNETVGVYWPLIVLITQGLAVWAIWSFKTATVSPEDLKTSNSNITTAIDKLDKDVNARWQDLSNEVSEQDKRIIKVEAQLEHMPTHEDFESIHQRIGGMSRSLSQVEGKIEAMSEQTSLIHNHLLNQAKGK